jgi:hypothetical protein
MALPPDPGLLSGSRASPGRRGRPSGRRAIARSFGRRANRARRSSSARPIGSGPGLSEIVAIAFGRAPQPAHILGPGPGVVAMPLYPNQIYISLSSFVRPREVPSGLARTYSTARPRLWERRGCVIQGGCDAGISGRFAVCFDFAIAWAGADYGGDEARFD